MLRFVVFLAILRSCVFCASAQTAPSLQYYLPDISYDTAIPTPAAVLGYEVGAWHVTHDQLLAYMRSLDQASDRISIVEYGRSHENRPLICLIITDPANRARLDEIKAARNRLVNLVAGAREVSADLPAVNYMGYSIHGNEASGSNAAMIVAYYLAAGQTPEVQNLLKNTVILLDPCFNPDGIQRFSSWVNSRRSRNGATDPVADEFNEPWPKGRYNHYWFDLNRDWIVAQQPETRGRVALFQEWHPNVLTDHHEMGSHSTFFFQPGVPSRVHPITPLRNQELTAQIAVYHAKKLSGEHVLFYSGENFDDFYYGKGSTYPDAQGSIGILFEQASSRGSAQETANGLLRFPYTIRNHVLASLSTLEAIGDLRVQLNEYLRDFYKTALEEARKDDIKGYVFADNRDLPANALLAVLMRHRIEVHNLSGDLRAGGEQFQARNAFWVPAEQPQYRLVKALFERRTTFQDSIFYDISAWTLPDAFGVKWSPVSAKEYDPQAVGRKGLSLVSRYGLSIIGQPAYAYVVPATGYEVPQVLYRLMRAGVRVKVAMNSFLSDGQTFQAGSLVIPSENQEIADTALLDLMNGISGTLPVYAIANGLTSLGPDLGSNKFPTLRTPKVLMITGDGVSPESAGEIWHLLDTRYEMPVTMVESDRTGRVNFLDYNVLILPDGNYPRLSAEKVREFARNGGTVVALGGALRWLKGAGLAMLEFRNAGNPNSMRRAYEYLDEDRGARRMPGAIFEAELDLSHPLCFGYERTRLPMFLGDTTFIETAKNPYATPAVFTAAPLLAGYIHAGQKPLVANSAAVVVCGTGRGRIICFAGDPNFRAFWYGTNRLFANAIFWGNLVSSEAVERN
ncbi:MAG: M14 family metallopeptidase [Saprospiraceae bacterium]